MEWLYELDTKWFYMINQGWHNDLLNYLFIFLTNRNSAILILVIYLSFLIYKKKRVDWVYLLVLGATVGLTDFVSSSILKPIFERVRPCQVLTEVNFWNQGKEPAWLITDGVTDYKSSKSFPSSHAANSMAFAMMLGSFYPKLAVTAISFAVLIGISRVYVGVHYPSDVLGGMVVGIFIATISHSIYEWAKNRFVNNENKK